jgi:hypothetical protein
MKFDPKHYPSIDFDNPGTKIRDDLRLVRTAEKMGYVVEEQRLGDPLLFRLHRNPPELRRVIWFCDKGWACAELDNGCHVNHRYYPELLEALTTEKDI